MKMSSLEDFVALSSLSSIFRARLPVLFGTDQSASINSTPAVSMSRPDHGGGLFSPSAAAGHHKITTQTPHQQHPALRQASKEPPLVSQDVRMSGASDRLKYPYRDHQYYEELRHKASSRQQAPHSQHMPHANIPKCSSTPQQDSTQHQQSRPTSQIRINAPLSPSHQNPFITQAPGLPPPSRTVYASPQRNQVQEPPSPHPSSSSAVPSSTFRPPYDPPAPKTVLHDLNVTVFPAVFFIFLTAAATSVIIYAFVLERATPKRWTAGAIITLVVILGLWALLRFVRYGLKRRRMGMGGGEKASATGWYGGGRDLESAVRAGGPHRDHVWDQEKPPANLGIAHRIKNFFSLDNYRAKRSHARTLHPKPKFVKNASLSSDGSTPPALIRLGHAIRNLGRKSGIWIIGTEEQDLSDVAQQQEWSAEEQKFKGAGGAHEWTHMTERLELMLTGKRTAERTKILEGLVAEGGMIGRMAHGRLEAMDMPSQREKKKTPSLRRASIQSQPSRPSHEPMETVAETSEHSSRTSPVVSGDDFTALQPKADLPSPGTASGSMSRPAQTFNEMGVQEIVEVPGLLDTNVRKSQIWTPQDRQTAVEMMRTKEKEAQAKRRAVARKPVPVSLLPGQNGERPLPEDLARQKKQELAINKKRHSPTSQGEIELQKSLEGMVGVGLPMDSEAYDQMVSEIDRRIPVRSSSLSGKRKSKSTKSKGSNSSWSSKGTSGSKGSKGENKRKAESPEAVPPLPTMRETSQGTARVDFGFSEPLKFVPEGYAAEPEPLRSTKQPAVAAKPRPSHSQSQSKLGDKALPPPPSHPTPTASYHTEIGTSSLRVQDVKTEEQEDTETLRPDSWNLERLENKKAAYQASVTTPGSRTIEAIPLQKQNIDDEKQEVPYQRSVIDQTSSALSELDTQDTEVLDISILVPKSDFQEDLRAFQDRIFGEAKLRGVYGCNGP